jgi:hypothetical protein
MLEEFISWQRNNIKENTCTDGNGGVTLEVLERSLMKDPEIVQRCCRIS